jgi:hypothetical protein
MFKSYAHPCAVSVWWAAYVADCLHPREGFVPSSHADMDNQQLRDDVGIYDCSIFADVMRIGVEALTIAQASVGCVRARVGAVRFDGVRVR